MTLPLPESITLHEIRVPFREPLVTRDGTFTERRSVLVAVTREGMTGWGEAAAFPSGTWGTSDEAWLALTTVSPGTLPEQPLASAALQGARADLQARLRGQPLHRFLGGRRRPARARHTVGLTTTWPAFFSRVEAVVDSGVSAIKVKVAPGNDVDPIRRLRQAFPDLDVTVDGNASYSDPHDEALLELDRLGVSVIEQPFPPDDLGAHALLRHSVAAKVCLDESISSVANAISALAAGAADMLSVKLGRLGLHASATVLGAARDAGVAVKAGGTFDTAIGRRHLLAFATLTGVTDAEVAPPSGYLSEDVASYPALVEGAVTPDEEPGIGVDPESEPLTRLEIRRAEVSA